MSKNLLKALPELVTSGVISAETADAIRSYYDNAKDDSRNRLLIIFGVLGAVLIALGIILILAHNWDDMNRAVKTALAFLPLLAGQAACLYSLLKKDDSPAWKESSSIFLFLTIAASISLVAQIYNISGNFSRFLLTWMLLGLPLVYIMRSSSTALLFLAGITWYVCSAGYWHNHEMPDQLYWLMLLAILPYYYQLFKKDPGGNYLVFFNWMVPLSLTIAFGTLATKEEELMFIAYFSLFAVFYLVSDLMFPGDHKFRNGYMVIGLLGSIGMLMAMSFDDLWRDLVNEDLSGSLQSTELWAALLVTLAAVALSIRQNLHRPVKDIHPMHYLFIVFILLFFLGRALPVVSLVLINLLIISVALWFIFKGIGENHLGLLNAGLLIITALIICRFFDTDIPFVLRGILFLAVGAGFFLGNYMMLQKKKTIQ
jgi:uncharacterized membrane protein